MLKHLAGLAALALAAAPLSAAVIEFTGQTINEGPSPAPGGRCELPALTFSMSPEVGPVSGTSNLGNFTPELSHCIVLPPPTAFTDGLFDFDFGGGDSFFGTYVGFVAPTDTAGLVAFEQQFTITGGNGRFAGATGSLAGEGTIQFRPGQNPIGIASLSGSIEIVPEPATLALLGSGVAWLALRRRKAGRSVKPR